jgi:hypothetical protein
MMKGFDELNVRAEAVTHKANSHLEWIVVRRKNRVSATI